LKADKILRTNASETSSF